MPEIPVVFTFDKRIILGAAVAIKSLIDSANHDTVYRIYVYHPDIDNKTIIEFQKMFENSRHKINFEFVDKKRFKDAPISKGSWREVVYYRLLIPELLKNYDKVIYSDVDVLFKKDLSEVYSTDIENFEWGGIKAEVNNENTISHRYFTENKNEFIFWSGFMLINSKKMREENKIETFFETIKNFKERLKFFDLDTINLSTDKIKPLDLKYCVLESIYAYDDFTKAKEYKYLKNVYSNNEITNAKNDPAIIHYAGELGKPWRRKNPPDEYKNYINKIPKKLRKYTFRDLRKRLMSKI